MSGPSFNLNILEGMQILEPMVQGGWRILPNDALQVAEVLKTAQENGWQLALREEEAQDLHCPIWLDLSKLRELRKYRIADLTITVGSGMTFNDLWKLTMPQGHQFPLQYPDEWMLANVLAEDYPSLETAFCGYPRDYVLGLEIATPDGKVTKCGGEVVKNVTGYDLNKLYIGSSHTLGVITAVTLKLAPKPEASRSWLFEFSDIQRGFQTIQRLFQQALPLSRCELFHKNRLSISQQQKSIAPWQLLVEVSGPSELVRHAAAVIRSCASYPESETVLHPVRENALLRILSNFDRKSENMPNAGIILELALSYGSAQDFYFHIASFLKSALKFQTSAGEGYPALQIRPGGDFFYLVWPETMFPDPAYFQKNIDHLVQLSARFQADLRFLHGPVSLRPLFNQYNLPGDQRIQTLMRRIKAEYDPTGVLYSRLLPLESIVSNECFH